MTVKEVMASYHKKVPFPISSTEIKAAGYDVTQYITDMIMELRKCEDSDTFLCQDLKALVTPQNTQ